MSDSVKILFRFPILHPPTVGTTVRLQYLVRVLRRKDNLNYFLVGAREIGCEMLKKWALVRVRCDESGHLQHVRVMNRIEKSNPELTVPVAEK